MEIPFVNTIATGRNIDNLVILAAILGVTLDEIVVVDTVVTKCG